jgi:hypothetical protein
VVKKTKVRVLVKIFSIEDGDEGEILRQFEVKEKAVSEGALALDVFKTIDKEYEVENEEAWAI